MASAMIGSQGRDSRRPRRVTLFSARLPLLLMFSFLLLAHTSSNYAARAQETGQHPPHEEKVEVSMILSSCADLPNKWTEVYGVVSVVGDIVCREKRIIRITTRDDVEVAIIADQAINFKGVHFEVPAGTGVLFGASAMTFTKHKDSTEGIFNVDGHLSFYVDAPLYVPEESTEEDTHSILRLNEGALFETDGIMRFTDSSLTVAAEASDKPAPIGQDSTWAQRPRYENPSFNAPPLFSMFAPPFTTRETVVERLDKRILYIATGDELHWPSTLSIDSLKGPELAIGVDGSLLFTSQAAAAAAAALGADDELVYVPPVTLIAANSGQARRVFEKRQSVAVKAGNLEISSRKDGLKVPGGAGGFPGGVAILTVTDMGDVEVTLDGKRVLHQAAPNNDRTWRRKMWDKVTRHKRPKGVYEMHLVSNGFEVRLDGVPVWGMRAAELSPWVS